MKPTFNKKLNEKADALAKVMVEIFDMSNVPSYQMLHVLDADDCKVTSPFYIPLRKTQPIKLSTPPAVRCTVISALLKSENILLRISEIQGFFPTRLRVPRE